MPTTTNNPNRAINETGHYEVGDDRRYLVTGRPCTACDRTGQEHRIINSRSRGRAMHTICVECERSRNAARRAQGPRTPRVTVGQPLGLARRFGVEIECNMTGGYQGATYNRAQRLFTEAGLTTWRLGSDGSLGSQGVEVRSPILSGEDGMEQVKKALAILRDVGATVDRRCGLHVHHEVRDIGRDGLVHFIRSWAANQNLIDWLVSPSRRGTSNYYCQPWDENGLRALDRMDASGRYAPGERYKTANVHSYARFGTVEIRQHQGTLSFRKVEGWINLVQAMLDTVAGRGRAFGASGSLRQFFEALGSRLDEDAGAFLLGRAVQFGAPSETLAASAA